MAILFKAYFGVYTLFLIDFFLFCFVLFYIVGFKIWTTVGWIFLINKKATCDSIGMNLDEYFWTNHGSLNSSNWEYWHKSWFHASDMLGCVGCMAVLQDCHALLDNNLLVIPNCMHFALHWRFFLFYHLDPLIILLTIHLFYSSKTKLINWYFGRFGSLSQTASG